MKHRSIACRHFVDMPQQVGRIMTDKRVRHLPALDNGKVVGLISIGDLVKDIISEQKFVIEQLEHYIMS